MNGDAFYSNALVNMPLLDSDKGVYESETFSLICIECDSKNFGNYEILIIMEINFCLKCLHK